MSEFVGFNDLLRRRFAEQHRGRNVIGSVVMNALKNYLKIEDDETVSGYVKNGNLFIKTKQQIIKIKIFKEKKMILTYVNNSLLNVGYNVKLEKIVFK